MSWEWYEHDLTNYYYDVSDDEALPTSHNMAAVYLFYLRSLVLSFFDRKLSEDGDHSTAVMPDELCVEH